MDNNNCVEGEVGKMCRDVSSYKALREMIAVRSVTCVLTEQPPFA